jgi:hypothetical protein
MSRIILTCCFAALLASCSAVGVNKIDLANARLACADIGIDPSNPAFNQCAFDLYSTLVTTQEETQEH